MAADRRNAADSVCCRMQNGAYGSDTKLWEYEASQISALFQRARHRVQSRAKRRWTHPRYGSVGASFDTPASDVVAPLDADLEEHARPSSIDTRVSRTADTQLFFSG